MTARSGQKQTSRPKIDFSKLRGSDLSLASSSPTKLKGKFAIADLTERSIGKIEIFSPRAQTDLVS